MIRVERDSAPLKGNEFPLTFTKVFPDRAKRTSNIPYATIGDTDDSKGIGC